MFRILLANNKEISRTPCSCNINASAFEYIQNIYNGFPSTDLLLYFPCNDTSNLRDDINGVTLEKAGKVKYAQEAWKASELCVATNGNETTASGYFSTTNANFTMPSTFTLMCMLKPKYGGYGNAPVVEIGSYDKDTGFGIWMNGKRLSCRVNQSWDYYGDAITDDWHHAAFVYDEQYAILYVDGEVYHTRSLPNPPNYTTDINIGSRYPGGGVAWENYNGYIDDIRLYSYPMTQEEILRIARRYGVVENGDER